MNFISSMESAQVQLELKYCERCGGLFLRPEATEVVYCGGCTAFFATRPGAAGTVNPAPARRTRNPRIPKGPNTQRRLPGAAQIRDLRAVAVAEVWS